MAVQWWSRPKWTANHKLVLDEIVHLDLVDIQWKAGTSNSVIGKLAKILNKDLKWTKNCNKQVYK